MSIEHGKIPESRANIVNGLIHRLIKEHAPDKEQLSALVVLPDNGLVGTADIHLIGDNGFDLYVGYYDAEQVRLRGMLRDFSESSDISNVGSNVGAITFCSDGTLVDLRRDPTPWQSVRINQFSPNDTFLVNVVRESKVSNSFLNKEFEGILLKGHTNRQTQLIIYPTQRAETNAVLDFVETWYARLNIARPQENVASRVIITPTKVML
ncbi:hypothetical protein HGA88_05155 [Candidatus Roizmanbacteria bacterium]|nr:hypothetical protein [Candidatus Roizmanbacteria bacterium]